LGTGEGSIAVQHVTRMADRGRSLSVNITEIMLKVALNTITPRQVMFRYAKVIKI
jgi:hypothetical protein